MSTDNQWLNVQDIAELLQIKDETVRRWIRRNELPVLELGGPRAGYRVRREDLDHFIWQRYRMRQQHDEDRAFRSEFEQSAERTRGLESVSLHQDQSPDAHEVGDFGYVSLMSRIPGVTYVATVPDASEDILQRQFAFISEDFQELTGQTAAALRENAQVWWDLVDPRDLNSVRQAIQQSYADKTRYSIEYRFRGPGGICWVRDEGAPSEDLKQWQGLILNISERKQIEASLHARVTQHTAVAELGDRALNSLDLETLMTESVNYVQKSLDVDFTKVLQLLPGGDELIMRAGVGWSPGAVNRAKVSSGAESQAGYTLLSNEPVIVNDLDSESRFSGPALLKNHGVRSGISVIIAGHGMPWGVFGAHSRDQRQFTSDDVYFLQSVANVLAGAIRTEAGSQQYGKWLSIRDIADALQVKEETVRRWIRRGELPIIDLGSSRAGYRIHPADLEEFIRERYMVAEPGSLTR